MEDQNECSGDTTLPLRYIHPHFALTMEEMTRFRDDNSRCLLLAHKKLHLVLDLDRTLIHAKKKEKLTVEEKESVKSTPDVYEIFQGRYVMKLRPGIREFLEEVTSMFDLSIYTMGTRSYAQEVHKLLESKVGFPKSSWVIAKEDCTKKKQKRLDVLLMHERVIVIVDDTKEVWGESCDKNLVQIARYNFFPIKKGVREVDTELARVLSILKGVHNAFYDGSFAVDKGAKDVRELLTLVPPHLRLLGAKDRHNYADKDRKVDESHIDQGSSSITRGLKRSRSEDKNVACVEKIYKRLVVKFNGKRWSSSSTSEEKSRLDNNIVSNAPTFQSNTCIAAPICKKLVIKFAGLAH